LDAVFSKFFQKLENLSLVYKPRSAGNYIESNRDEIVRALSKGHTYEDLASLLKESGFSMSASTLRRYVGSIKSRTSNVKIKEVMSEDSSTSSIAQLNY